MENFLKEFYALLSKHDCKIINERSKKDIEGFEHVDLNVGFEDSNGDRRYIFGALISTGKYNGRIK